MLKEMRYARDGMHSSAHCIALCVTVVKQLEGSVVADLIDGEMGMINCGVGTMMRCCDWRMVAAQHARVFRHCQHADHKRLMELCGHMTKMVYLPPAKRTRRTVFAFGVIAMLWQSLLKKLCPREGTNREFKRKYGMTHTALFGRYYHFWSMEAVLQTRLQSLRCTITERHEAFFARMKPILHDTSNSREDQDYLLRAADREQMELIFGEIFLTQQSHTEEASKMTKVFDGSSPLTDITLSHEEVSSRDYVVFCCMFSDYMNSAWMEVKPGGEERVVNDRKVREVVLHITGGGGDESASLFSDVHDDIQSMKAKLQVRMQQSLQSAGLPGWEKQSVVAVMRTTRGASAWLPVDEQGGELVSEGSGGGDVGGRGDDGASDEDDNEDDDEDEWFNNEVDDGLGESTVIDASSSYYNCRQEQEQEQEEQEELEEQEEQEEQQETFDEASAKAYRLFTLVSGGGSHALFTNKDERVLLVRRHGRVCRAACRDRNDATRAAYQIVRQELLDACRAGYKFLNGLISTGFDQAEKNAAQDGLDLAGELIAALSRQTQPIRTAQFVIDTSNRIVEVRQQLQQQQLQQQLPTFRSLALPPAALDAARKKHEKESVKLAAAEADATVRQRWNRPS